MKKPNKMMKRKKPLACAALILWACSTLPSTLRAQQTAPPQPAASSVPLDRTMQFILATLNDPTKNHYGVAAQTRETYGAASKSQCNLEWGESTIVGGYADTVSRFKTVADLSKVDPLSITVIPVPFSIHAVGVWGEYDSGTTNPSGFQIYLSSTTGNQFADFTSFSFTFKPPITELEAEVKPAVCAPKQRGCTVTQTKVTRAFMFLSDEPAAYRVAKALRHAAELCAPPPTTPF